MTWSKGSNQPRSLFTPINLIQPLILTCLSCILSPMQIVLNKSRAGRHLYGAASCYCSTCVDLAEEVLLRPSQSLTQCLLSLLLSLLLLSTDSMISFKKFLKFTSADTVDNETRFFHDGKFHCVQCTIKSSLWNLSFMREIYSLIKLHIFFRNFLGKV